MLRSRSGFNNFKIYDKKTGHRIFYNLNSKLTPKQISMVSEKPDAIWQMAQRIKEEYALEGKNVKIFADCQISINQKPYKNLLILK